MAKVIKISWFPANTPKTNVLTSNGTVLDNYCLKCITTEDFGNYTADATFSLDALDYLNNEDILKIKLDYGYEIFRISKVDKDNKLIYVVARQITISESLSLYLTNVSISNLNGQAALTKLLNDSIGTKEITLSSNITNTYSANYADISLYEAISGSNDNFIDKLSGEVLRRGYDVYINASIGIDRGVTIREGKNLTGFNGSATLDNLITKARGKGFNNILGNWIDSTLINSYARVYRKTIDYSFVKVKGENDTEGFNTTAEAIAELDRLVGLEFSQKEIDKITGNYDINFVQLEKTEEYKNYIAAERVFLGDLVRVYVPRLDTDIKVRAISKSFNVLAEKTEEIKLSNTATNQVISTNKIINDLRKQYEETNNSSIYTYIDSIIKAGLQDSFIILRQNELLAMDSKDVNTATNVTRLNKNGLAFSKTGYYGTYDYGITIDGIINASFITTGVLSTILVQSLNGGSYLNLDTGQFQLGASDGTNVATHTNSSSTWRHISGENSVANSSGFFKNGRPYHTLMTAGYVITGGSVGTYPVTATIQLSSEWQNTNFTVLASTVDTQGGLNLEYMKRIELNVSNVDLVNARFDITGSWTGAYGENVNNKELRSMYIVIGG